MGRHKEAMMQREAALEAAAREQGRICPQCRETVAFDDVEASSYGMLCSHCRNLLYSDRT